MKKLSAEVERDVLRVDDALHEPHPLRDDLVGLALDQDLPAVQGHAAAAVAVHFEDA